MRVSEILKLIKIFFAITILEIQLKRYGFSKVFPKYVSKFKCDPSKRNKLSPETINQKISSLLIQIDTVCTLVPFEAQCLHRSFLGYEFIRKELGIPVDLVVGVRKFPFMAHAWLKVNDNNLNESPEYTAEFIPILNTKEEGFS